MPEYEARLAEVFEELVSVDPESPSTFLPRSSAAYLTKYPDVAMARVDPVIHWLAFGRHEGRQWPSSTALECQGARGRRVYTAGQLTQLASPEQMVRVPGLHAAFAPATSLKLSPPHVITEQDWHFCGPHHLEAFSDFTPTSFPSYVRSPEMLISHLCNVTCLPGQVAITKEGHVLAESYDFHSGPGQHHHIELSADGARISQEPASSVYQSGSFLYCDSQHEGHYGHFLSDVLSQAWAYHELVRHGADDLQVLLTRDVRPYMRVLLAGLGVPEQHILPVERPICCERLFLATKAFQVQGWTSTTAVRSWAKIRDALDTGAHTSRLFVSRSKNPNRGLVQAAEVDALFESRGFRIIHPEDLPLDEQVSLFANATLVAGLSGSNMFNLAFGRGRQHVFLICSPNLIHTSEQMLMAGRAVKWQLYVGSSATSDTHQPWTVDLVRLGAKVDSWLALTTAQT